eukprot:6450922-Prymnesium_polylepis.2
MAGKEAARRGGGQEAAAGAQRHAEGQAAGHVRRCVAEPDCLIARLRDCLVAWLPDGLIAPLSG